MTKNHDFIYDQTAYIIIQITTFLCSGAAFLSISLKLYKVVKDVGLCYAVYSLTQIAVIILFAFIGGSGMFYAWKPNVLKASWFICWAYVPWAMFGFMVHFKGRQYEKSRQRVQPMPDPDGEMPDPEAEG
ncbi:hypothetical protein L596_009938 [Steinernema carpocapsae]|nr:hypothetical protein L596_009938 [Steinernema carpocapsae]